MTRRNWIAMAVSARAAAGAQAGGASNKLVLLLVGPPGSGKSTQAAFLKRQYGLPAISAAELIKKSHDKKSEISKALKVGFESGELLNDEGLSALVRERILKGDALNGFVLDGFPANRKQADALAKMLEERALPPPTVVLLAAPDAVLKDRLLKRRRIDDTPANIDRRLAEYKTEEQFIIGQYKPEQIVRVDATQTEKDVSAAIVAGVAKVRK